jgi:cell wall-associated NlpC family hydrolase
VSTTGSFPAVDGIGSFPAAGTTGGAGSFPVAGHVDAYPTAGGNGPGGVTVAFPAAAGAGTYAPAGRGDSLPTIESTGSIPAIGTPGGLPDLAGPASPGTVTAGPPAVGVPAADKAGVAAAFARAQTGRPYVMGATGPGSYDAAGLVQAAWKAAGFLLPRTPAEQARCGTTVPLAAAHPGDLVFFHDDLSHVGIYTGNGMMIHAPRPGAYVREESVYFAGEAAVRGVIRLA